MKRGPLYQARANIVDPLTALCEQDEVFSQAPTTGRATTWRNNFAWALSGNVVYAACQWGMLVALAKLGDSFMVGQLSLGLAIATPVFMFTNLQLRAVQATDASRQYSFREYLGLRTVTIVIAWVAIAWITQAVRIERATVMVILTVAFIKGVEAVSDVFYGLFLLNDHLDRTGKSMMCRGVVSVAALGAGLYFLGSLVKAVSVLAAAWLAVLIFFDVRQGKRLLMEDAAVRLPAERRHGWRQVWPTFRFSQWRLVQVSLPLGIVMTLVSLNLSMPRYFVHGVLGEHQLGIFSAMAYTTVAVATFADALGHSMIPRLSRLYAAGDLDTFRSHLLKLVSAGAAVSVAGVVVAQVLGARLLRILFTPEYAAHANVFVWLILAGGIACIASLMNYGITSARYFTIQVPMFALVVGANALACAWLIPSKGLTGAAWAILAAASAHLAVSSAVLVYLFRSRPQREASPRAQAVCLDSWEPGL